ncbi:MAG: bifunctional phosphopantothenoylcysteine decarboxylase/phosphopantothenate--cysteine ligase CoaBC [Alphaproteobacteria bacterium]
MIALYIGFLAFIDDEPCMNSPDHSFDILLIITGGIAAYKALELIRLLSKEQLSCHVVMTDSAQKFITPLAVAALSGQPVYTDLWSLKDESEMGHIRLSREARAIVVAPATANFIAKAAHGLADDLASTILLAANKPILMAPAMNPAMWQHPATAQNIQTLHQRGVTLIAPQAGEMACGEHGVGRMEEPAEIVARIKRFLAPNQPLKGLKALVTSGPTHESIDPIRYITNHSSGKQGYAIAASLAEKGATVTLISGPVSLPPPYNVNLTMVKTADEMWHTCQESLPVDIAICTAAVADWKVKTPATHKMKKQQGDFSTLIWEKTVDILENLSKHPQRPRLVIGFAAETDNILTYARQKMLAKGCDWIIANEISDSNPVFGSDYNSAWFIEAAQQENWANLDKKNLAHQLAEKISLFFEHNSKIKE